MCVFEVLKELCSLRPLSQTSHFALQSHIRDENWGIICFQLATSSQTKHQVCGRLFFTLTLSQVMNARMVHASH